MGRVYFNQAEGRGMSGQKRTSAMLEIVVHYPTKPLKICEDSRSYRSTIAPTVVDGTRPAPWTRRQNRALDQHPIGGQETQGRLPAHFRQLPTQSHGPVELPGCVEEPPYRQSTQPLPCVQLLERGIVSFDVTFTEIDPLRPEPGTCLGTGRTRLVADKNRLVSWVCRGCIRHDAGLSLWALSSGVSSTERVHSPP